MPNVVGRIEHVRPSATAGLPPRVLTCNNTDDSRGVHVIRYRRSGVTFELMDDVVDVYATLTVPQSSTTITSVRRYGTTIACHPPAQTCVHVAGHGTLLENLHFEASREPSGNASFGSAPPTAVRVEPGAATFTLDRTTFRGFGCNRRGGHEDAKAVVDASHVSATHACTAYAAGVTHMGRYIMCAWQSSSIQLSRLRFFDTCNVSAVRLSFAKEVLVEDVSDEGHTGSGATVLLSFVQHAKVVNVSCARGRRSGLPGSRHGSSCVAGRGVE